jgi:hypothetical protein
VGRHDYATGNRIGPDKQAVHGARKHAKRTTGLLSKNLLMIPQRVALALQDDGWIIRAQIPWVKASAMPESVRDRPTVAHEYVFQLVKQQRYFWDPDAVRMPVSQTTGARAWRRIFDPSKIKKAAELKEAGVGGGNNGRRDPNATGRNIRTSDFFHAGLDELQAHIAYVRENGGMMLSDEGDPLAFMVNPVGSKLAHFAMWPPKLVKPMILSSTSEKGCCPKCGAQWARIVETGQSSWARRVADGHTRGADTLVKAQQKQGSLSNPADRAAGGFGVHAKRISLGFSPSCECNAGDPVPCRVLDPFAGSGTTLQVCEALGRDSWGVDLMTKNLPIIAERMKEKLDPQTMKRVVVKPERSSNGQQSIFEDVA